MTATSTSLPARRQLAAWLFVCCAMVFAMVVVGGVTRLTHSGLSIVEWQPIMGALPPLDEQAWQETFDKYKQTPQFRLVNSDMTLDGFKQIFWWEYAHRLLGRLIGMVFFLPLVYFIARKYVDRALAWRLGGIFLLGGLQGAVGWYMVKSGLVDDPRVSQLRLAAHLGLAFVIYAAIFLQALALFAPPHAAPNPLQQKLRRKACALAGLIFVMVMSGALVAGTHAGLVYNSFPLMHGHFIPPDILALDPWYSNFFNNLATVQFDHRLIAWLLSILVPLFWWRAHRLSLTPAARLCCNLLLAALVLQVSLGIATLLHAVPLALAALHQAGALLLFTAALAVTHFLRAKTNS